MDEIVEISDENQGVLASNKDDTLMDEENNDEKVSLDNGSTLDLDKVYNSMSPPLEIKELHCILFFN